MQKAKFGVEASCSKASRAIQPIRAAVPCSASGWTALYMVIFDKAKESNMLHTNPK